MKKLSAQLIVSLIVISFLISPVFAYGYVKTGSDTADLLQEGNYDLVTDDEVQYADASPLVTSAEQFIYNELINLSTSIDVRSYNIPAEDLRGLYSNVINDNPDLFYVSSSYHYNYYPSTGMAAYITPFYVLGGDELEEAREVFYSGADKALSELDDSMNDLQKAITLHEYVCNNATYPVLTYDESTQTYIDDYDIYHSAYGFFHDGYIVCAGYTLVYSYLMKQAGIDCEYVVSREMSHAWNRLKIDGKWYNADLTWDDFDLGDGVNIYGAMKHCLFLKSDEYFESESGYYHYDGVTYDDCTCDDTTYDSAFWDNVTSRIYTLNGNYYYLRPDDSLSRVYFTQRSGAGVEQQISVPLSSISLSYTSNHPDSEGVYHETTFRDVLSRLAYLDNRFYILSGKAVYSLTVAGKRYTITSNTDYSSGFAVNDSNNLIYQFYNDTATVKELDKLEYYNRFFTGTPGSNYNNYPDINYDLHINAKDFAYILGKG